MHACTLMQIFFTFAKDGKTTEEIIFTGKCMPDKDIDTSSEKLTEAHAEKTNHRTSPNNWSIFVYKKPNGHTPHSMVLNWKSSSCL